MGLEYLPPPWLELMVKRRYIFQSHGVFGMYSPITKRRFVKQKTRNFPPNFSPGFHAKLAAAVS